MARTVTTYQYDTRGRLTQTIDPIGGARPMATTQQQPDRGDQPATEIRQPINMIRRTDARRRLDAYGNSTISSYDPAGNVITKQLTAMAMSPLTLTIRLNRRTTVTDPLGYVTRYDYSSAGGPSCCSPTIVPASLRGWKMPTAM